MSPGKKSCQKWKNLSPDPFSVFERKVRLGLGCINRFVKSQPEPDGEAIVVAGTNGKGSVCAYLEALLQSLGFSTLVFTSPHVESVTERFRVNGEEISVEELNEYCKKIACGGFSLTYFEATFAAALLMFIEKKCDYGIFEVGMGGRLDATRSVPNKRWVVITDISLDHTQFLGNTLEKIATEKAFVIDPGVKAVVTSAEGVVLKAIEKRAIEVGSPVYALGRDFFIEKSDKKWVYRGFKTQLVFEISFPGTAQARNAALALALLEAMGQPLSQKSVSFLKKVFLPGRFELLKKGNRIFILDGAHNPASVENLVLVLTENRQYDFKSVLFGCLETKDYKRMLSLLAYHFDNIYLVDGFHPQAVPAETLANFCFGFLKINRVRDLHFFLQKKNNLVVCGSFYLIGMVRKILREMGYETVWNGWN